MTRFVLDTDHSNGTQKYSGFLDAPRVDTKDIKEERVPRKPLDNIYDSIVQELVMGDWESFLLAEAGAAAALTGLLFVSVSINLGRIVALPTLPERAFGALLSLLTVLVIASLGLVPGQPQLLLGGEVIGVAILTWVTITRIDVAIWQHAAREYRRSVALLLALNQLTMLLYVAGGVLLISRGLVGLYWIVPAMLISFLKAILDAWVLLVEINR